MALQTFGRGLVIPYPPIAGSSGPAMTGPAATTINANNEVFAVIIRAPKAGNLRSVWFRPFAVTTGGTITIGAYQVSLTTGDPADTPSPLATNTFITKAIATTDASDMINSGNFTADATLTKGQLFAVCFICGSPGDMSFSIFSDESAYAPYTSLFTGTWAKGTNPAVLALQYDDGSIAIPQGCVVFGTATAGDVNTTSIGTGTNPNVMGARFQFPGPVRVNGAWVWIEADGDYDLYLVDADWNGTSGDALATASVDTNTRPATNGGIAWVELNATVELAASTNYRLLVVPTSATTLNFYDYPVISSTMMGALPLGTNFHLTTAQSPNDDTDFTNYNSGTFRVPFMGLVIDAIDSGGAGGGGGLRMAGHGGLAS